MTASNTTPAGFPAGWSADTHAPFATYYNAEGTVGVTQDEDDTNLWFAVAFDEEAEEVKPLAADGTLLDWDTRPEMFDTPQEALAAALAATTPTPVTFAELADQINAAYAAGKTVTVNGRVVRSYSQPATVWGTGSLSVDVRAKSNGRPTAIWFTDSSLATSPSIVIK